MLRMLQFDSDFYNFWILKGLVLIGNRSNLSFSIIRFSSTKIFVVMKQFFKPLLIVQSIYLCKRQLFCWWFLIVFHEFLCYFCSCSFRKSLVFYQLSIFMTSSSFSRESDFDCFLYIVEGAFSSSLHGPDCWIFWRTK